VSAHVSGDLLELFELTLQTNSPLISFQRYEKKSQPLRVGFDSLETRINAKFL
jgi:hypothetical protein